MDVCPGLPVIIECSPQCGELHFIVIAPAVRSILPFNHVRNRCVTKSQVRKRKEKAPFAWLLDQK